MASQLFKFYKIKITLSVSKEKYMDKHMLHVGCPVGNNMLCMWSTTQVNVYAMWDCSSIAFTCSLQIHNYGYAVA